MSKFHTAVVTKSGEIYTYGHSGRTGRLGLGHHRANETVMTPTLVDGIWDVAHISLGCDHSIAITRNGSIFTWGSNKHGQLGYILESSSSSSSHHLDSNTIQSTPKEVGGILKKVRVSGVAASKFHTACFSSAGQIYTWGQNVIRR